MSSGSGAIKNQQSAHTNHASITALDHPVDNRAYDKAITPRGTRPSCTGPRKSRFRGIGVLREPLSNGPSSFVSRYDCVGKLVVANWRRQNDYRPFNGQARCDKFPAIGRRSADE